MRADRVPRVVRKRDEGVRFLRTPCAVRGRNQRKLCSPDHTRVVRKAVRPGKFRAAGGPRSPKTRCNGPEIQDQSGSVRHVPLRVRKGPKSARMVVKLTTSSRHKRPESTPSRATKGPKTAQGVVRFTTPWVLRPIHTPLDGRPTRRYAGLVVVNPTTGFDDLKTGRRASARPQSGAFFASAHRVMAGCAGRPSGLPVSFRAGSSTPCSPSPYLLDDSGDGTPSTERGTKP